MTTGIVPASPTAVVTPALFGGELRGHEFLMTSLRTGNTEVFRFDPYSGDATNLTRSPNSHQRYPMWSPDGERFLFTSDRDGAYNLFIAKADGSDVEQLTHVSPPSAVYLPSWSRDDLIAFGISGTNARIEVMDARKREVQVVAPGRDPHISANGAAITFTNWVETGYCVFVLDLKTTEVRQLTSHQNHIGAVTPTFSPDGKRILYSDSLGEVLEIFSLDVATGDIQQLTNFGMFATSPAWSPDQQWISFRLTDQNFWNDATIARQVHEERRGDKRPVWVMRADGREPHVLETLRYQCAIDGSRAVWHPKVHER
jgi:TolB protein